MSRICKKNLQRVFSIYLPITITLIFVLIPIYWIVNMSLKQDSEILSKSISYFPRNPTFTTYSGAWNQIGFARFFKNSMIVSTSSAFIILILAITTGYAIARYRFRFKSAFMIILLTTQFFPGSMLLMPLYTIYKNLGLLNTTYALVITYALFQIAFNSILMSGFIKSVPYELEEAAKIDGCNGFRVITQILIPLLLPGIVAGFSYAFINSWKEFLFSFMLNNTSAKHTISVGLHYMIGELTIDFGKMAAGGVIAMIPPLVIFLYLQKYLVSGLASGAVKG